MSRKYSSTGYYHIIMRGNERKNIFVDDKDRQHFLGILAKKKNDAGFSMYAYCLMDNHIHLLLNDEKNEISVIMKGIATSYAMYFNSKYERVGHVFQDRFKSEPIENERHLLAAIRYIHNNSVKAGMVEKPEQWAWSSYRGYFKTDIPEVQIVNAQYILGIISQDLKMAIREFKRFSKEKDDSDFLDYDNEGVARKVQEGMIYLEKYLKKEWPETSIEEIRKDPVMRKEVITELRSNTQLSVRKIAELMGVDRGVVERAMVNSLKDNKGFGET